MIKTLEQVNAEIAALGGPPCIVLSKDEFDRLRTELRAAHTLGISVDRLAQICEAENGGRLLIGMRGLGFDDNTYHISMANQDMLIVCEAVVPGDLAQALVTMQGCAFLYDWKFIEIERRKPE